ncbi:hemerythrin domain-containing protein [Caldimonas brevitalea]|uniref:Regulator of cell morphogenesis and NO signaling n=1 Tax=Caldimonas brevitalea TaxID=413882 RepID=A0A0G3BVH2_9BURK|nr:hemerythrin domain-containing protein [Caldimonas brevitalea]AKJ30535.1 regulator of cell morphogenesis and NO signaling [Caldimonas brevitalea]
MTTRNSSTRADVFDLLKDDHKRIKKAFRDYAKLDPDTDHEARRQYVEQVCAHLERHATLEETLFYPAARTALDDQGLVEEAEVEHDAAKALILQVRATPPDHPRFAALFTVLGEYVKHHVKEEENDLFKQISRADIQWGELLADMKARRAELEREGEATPSAHTDHDLDQDGHGARGAGTPLPPPRGTRSSQQHKVIR